MAFKIAHALFANVANNSGSGLEGRGVGLGDGGGGDESHGGEGPRLDDDDDEREGGRAGLGGLDESRHLFFLGPSDEPGKVLRFLAVMTSKKNKRRGRKVDNTRWERMGKGWAGDGWEMG